MAYLSLKNPGIDTIPNYLRAESPSSLRRLMFKTNLKHHGFVQYESIQYVEAEKRWYAWYYIDIKKLKDRGESEEVTDGN